MINNILVFLFCLWLGYCLNNNFEKGLLKYIVLSLVLPNAVISNYIISFEIIGFIVVVLFVIVKHAKYVVIKKPYRNLLTLLVYLCLIISSSAITMLKYSNNNIFFPLFSIFRILIIMILLKDIIMGNTEKKIDYIITPVLYINAIVSLIQLSFSNSINIFYQLYYKDSLTPLNRILSLGYFDRAYGTFGTPVLLGVFSVFCFSMYLGFIFERKNIENSFFKMIISFVLGFIALSKTAIIGIPLIFILSFILVIMNIIKVYNKKIFVLPFLLITLFSFISIWLFNRNASSASWYFQYLLDPLSSFETRYNLETGIFTSTYDTIRNNLLFGVGAGSLGNDFIGDSLYINVLYSTGIIGFMILIGLYLKLFIKNIKKKNSTAILIIISVFLIGTAAPIQFDIISVVFIVYAIVKSEISISENSLAETEIALN